MTNLCYLYTFIIALSNQFNITNVEWKWVLLPAVWGLTIDAITYVLSMSQINNVIRR